MSKRKRKSGRPKMPAEDQLSVRVEVRFSPRHIAQLKKIVKHNLSTWIRYLVITEIEKYDKTEKIGNG